MWQDVADLRHFYASPLGQTARRLIRRRIRAYWPDTAGLSVLGIGFAVPYLRMFLEDAERVAALMPDVQGVTHWPTEGRGLTALGREDALPFADNGFDRIVLIHAVESSERRRRLLREAWRVLAGGGKIIVVVPNRSGLWARIERTPFGHGHPYTQPQLVRLMRDNLFVPVRSDHALYMPPSRSRLVRRLAPAWERYGERWAAPFGGVLVMEAEKQIYGAIPFDVETARRRAAATASTSN